MATLMALSFEMMAANEKLSAICTDFWPKMQSSAENSLKTWRQMKTVIMGYILPFKKYQGKRFNG